MTTYLLPALFLLLSLLFGWLAGSVFKVSGISLVVLRAVLTVLGIGAAILAWWLLSRRRGGAAAAHPGGAELPSILESAQRRLQAAQRGNSASAATLPLLYVLGAPNSAKTTLITQCGMDPELLAGQVHHDGGVLPTAPLNVWYAGQNLMVDAGKPLTQSASLWSALVRQTSLGTLPSLLRRHRPLRAAVVCISTESFFGPDAAKTVATLGRETNSSLREIARQLGTDLPVHVILTKLDRVPGFGEYVRQLSREEAAERLGFTLPAENFDDGLYADKASAQIASALDALIFSLSEFRLEMLSRETDAAPTPAIYQFPRELQKLRNTLTSYLVELARPSHLQTNPLLRSFSCVGLRAQVLEESVLTPAAVPRAAASAADATGIFSLREMDAGQQPSSLNTTRRVAQWCFLPSLFPTVFLAHGEQEARSATSPRVRVARRVALSAATALLLTWGVGLTVSYIYNLSLERELRELAAELPANHPAESFASESELASLDRLRQALLRLEQFQQDGAPWRYRWGLYRGQSLLQPARALYFQRFQWALLDATETNLQAGLGALPASAPADADYLAAYNPLRAYLITTSFPQYSTGEFLAPVLTLAWLGNRHPQGDRREQLATEQFRFFGDELRHAPIYHLAPAMPVVTHARAYLNSFGSFNRIYQNMLLAASHTSPAIDFNRMFPGSSATVVEPHIVPGAFSRAGYAFMLNAMHNPGRYFAGEPWVLGDEAPVSTQGDSLSQQLAARYNADFSAQWQSYLRAASVVRFRTLGEASQKLSSLSSPSSALLALVGTASQQTAAASPPVAHQFQAAQALVPPDLNSRLIAPSNTAYINGLISLQAAVSQFIQDPGAASNPAQTQAVIAAAVNAHSAVSQTAQAFNVDPAAHVEQMVIKLLQEPITSVEEAIRGAAPAQINAGGRQFCSALSLVLAEYPFDRTATREATPGEVTTALQPGSGVLWQFYNTNLKSLVVQQGSQWVAAPGASPQPTPQFLQFFNRVATLSNAFFPAGATAPGLQFTVHIPQSPGIQSVTLALDAQKVSGADVSKQFNWSPQSSQQAQLIASYGSNNLPLQFTGNWALFHLVDRGRVEQALNPTRLAYPLEISGTPIVVNGTSLTERIEFSGPGAAVLTPGARSALRCTPQIVR